MSVAGVLQPPRSSREQQPWRGNSRPANLTTLGGGWRNRSWGLAARQAGRPASWEAAPPAMRRQAGDSIGLPDMPHDARWTHAAGRTAAKARVTSCEGGHGRTEFRGGGGGSIEGGEGVSGRLLVADPGCPLADTSPKQGLALVSILASREKILSNSDMRGLKCPRRRGVLQNAAHPKTLPPRGRNCPHLCPSITSPLTGV